MSREKFKELVDEGKEWPNRGQKMVEDRRTAIAWASRRIEKLEKVREAADTHQCTYKRKVALQASLPRTRLRGQRPPPEPCSICQALRDAEEE